MDLSILSRSEGDLNSGNDSQYQNINVLENFPRISSSGMDGSQMMACERMLTKRIAIIQGPPGTGKTFVSVSALRLMLANLGPGDPPIIVAAQTNHALDQMLQLIMKFEPEVLRLGGRSEDKDIVKRTVFELRESLDKNIPSNAQSNPGYTKLKARVHEIRTAMAPLIDGALLTANSLLRDGFITQQQYDSLHADAGWNVDDVNGRDGLEKCESYQYCLLLGYLELTCEQPGLNGQIAPVPHAPSINFGLPLEEADLDFEHLQQLEFEAASDDEAEETPRSTDRREVLSGTWVPFHQKFTGKFFGAIIERKMKKYLSNDDLYLISQSRRGEVYRYFEMLQNERILKSLKAILKEYKSAVELIRSRKASELCTRNAREDVLCSRC